MVFGPPGPNLRGISGNPDRPFSLPCSRLEPDQRTMTGRWSGMPRAGRCAGDRPNLLLVGEIQESRPRCRTGTRGADPPSCTPCSTSTGWRGKVRLAEGCRRTKNRVGELYLDGGGPHRGAFVAAGLFEASRASPCGGNGLRAPHLSATRYGGDPGRYPWTVVSGFHIDPTRGAWRPTARMEEFSWPRSRGEPELWDPPCHGRPSAGWPAATYWPLYAARFLTLSRILRILALRTHLERDRPGSTFDIVPYGPHVPPRGRLRWEAGDRLPRGVARSRLPGCMGAPGRTFTPPRRTSRVRVRLRLHSATGARMTYSPSSGGSAAPREFSRVVGSVVRCWRLLEDPVGVHPPHREGRPSKSFGRPRMPESLPCLPW